MFREIQGKLRGLRIESVAFDPAKFEDDVAMQTDWEPAKGGGASFRTHTVMLTEPSRIEFRSTAGHTLFCLVFLIVGLGVALGFGFAFFNGSKPSNADSPLPLLIPVGVGAIFAAVGGWMLYASTTPIVFDKGSGRFWKGRSTVPDRFRPQDSDRYTRLDRSHALQVISERCPSSSSSFYSYELNLVLVDGKRLNVVDHGDAEKLRADAKVLSRFLGAPVWDARGP